MTDYTDFRSTLNAIVKILAPHHPHDGRRAMAGKLAEAAAGKAIDNLAFKYRDMGHLFFPDDTAAAIELGERISAARKAGEIASIIPFGEDGLLPTDLLTWTDCPPVSANNPLSYWLPVTETCSPAVTTAPTPKRGRRPGDAPAMLAHILEALDSYAAATGQDFDRRAMPGPLGESFDDEGSFHWLCASLYPGTFKRAKATFEKHRAGTCALGSYAKPTDFYRLALPHIAPKLGVTLNVRHMPKKGRKIA